MLHKMDKNLNESVNKLASYIAYLQKSRLPELYKSRGDENHGQLCVSKVSFAQISSTAQQHFW